MAGRGRGRGRGSGFGINLEQFGLKKGDAIPAPTLEPPPDYPPLPFRPVPLEVNDYQKYLVEIKQEIRSYWRNSRFHIDSQKPPKSVVRYSDKYENLNNQKSGESLEDLDEKLFPEELRSKKKASAGAAKRKSVVSLDTIAKKLKSLEERDEKEEGPGKSDNEDEEEEEGKAEGAEEVQEEEIEEETDYALTYFDNGEGYLDDSDDALDEGPTY